ncbi:MAG TPA: TadE/TadG family type IV pilus assembly protein [Propionibacteriaceae bacterium]|nr:TadE/TadG family type IV pilus assembly protein [Propionibacteriaceae bacterium]
MTGTCRSPRSGTGPARRPRDAGAVAVELALITPALMMVIGLLVFGYRFWEARAAVQSAAGAAARAASLAPSPDAGAAAARRLALADLDTLGVPCVTSSVTSDTSALSTPAGRAGTVRVSVTCVVSMTDLVVPGAPGRLSVTRSATEPVDSFRERRP